MPQITQIKAKMLKKVNQVGSGVISPGTESRHYKDDPKEENHGNAQPSQHGRRIHQVEGAQTKTVDE
eukprot:CAMPEP_0114692198 /NCGR_PEP_ID=MMETSP0191-20121206/67694_1 /TAXON_ID=126664 /ORGANISM="Sorites sp." /LENGTH=66 /DNA_ID=CAMNT_0001984353 /DNA_START=72 /DNA_END=268 /DNA_ORIENTATION=+